jgi:hypothetical protein
MGRFELLLLLLLLLQLQLALSQVVVLAALGSLLKLHDNTKISRMWYKSPSRTANFQNASSFLHNRKTFPSNRLINRCNGVLLRQITPLQ